MRALFAVCAGVALTAGCASQGTLRDGYYQDAHTRYRVAEPPPGWERVRFQDQDVAYAASDSGHLLALNATCEDYEDAPLPVLTRHLTLGFTEREVHAQQRVPLDGREALRTRLTARLDGVPVEMELVVLKKDGCIYDFTYLAPAGRFEARHAALDALLGAFHARGRL